MSSAYRVIGKPTTAASGRPGEHGAEVRTLRIAALAPGGVVAAVGNAGEVGQGARQHSANVTTGVYSRQSASLLSGLAACSAKPIVDTERPQDLERLTAPILRYRLERLDHRRIDGIRVDVEHATGCGRKRVGESAQPLFR